ERRHRRDLILLTLGFERGEDVLADAQLLGFRRAHAIAHVERDDDEADRQDDGDGRKRDRQRSCEQTGRRLLHGCAGTGSTKSIVAGRPGSTRSDIAVSPSRSCHAVISCIPGGTPERSKLPCSSGIANHGWSNTSTVADMCE